MSWFQNENLKNSSLWAEHQKSVTLWIPFVNFCHELRLLSGARHSIIRVKAKNNHQRDYCSKEY